MAIVLFSGVMKERQKCKPQDSVSFRFRFNRDAFAQTNLNLNKKITAAPQTAVNISYTVPPRIAVSSYKQGDNNDLILQIKIKIQELGYYREDAELSGACNGTKGPVIFKGRND